MPKNTNLSKETIAFLKTRSCYTENRTVTESIGGLIGGINSDREALDIRIEIIDVGIKMSNEGIKYIEEESVCIQSIFTRIIHRIRIIDFLKGLEDKKRNYRK